MVELAFLAVAGVCFYQPFHKRFNTLVDQGDLDEPRNISLDAR